MVSTRQPRGPYVAVQASSYFSNRSVATLLLASAVKLTFVAGENLTVGSTVWLPAESVAPGR
jgi:hypothetical protein